MQPWTYSQLDSYESCPRKFYHLKVKKDVVDPPSEHTIWGSKVHDAFERRIRDGEPLPEGMVQWEPIAAKVDALPGKKYTEFKLSIDRNFQPTQWSASWARGIADLIVVNGDAAAVLDYKTGKRKPSEQLQLYAGLVFATFPEVDVVKTGFVWLKDRKVDRDEAKRDEIPTLWRPLLQRYAKLMSAYERGSWPAKTSWLCRAWCPVLSCEFNGKRER